MNAARSQKYSITFSPRKMLLVSMGYLLALASAELIIYHKFLAWGTAVYLIILFSLVINGALAVDQRQRGLWVALGLAPLIRIVSLAIPVILEISQYLWYIIVSIPIIVGIITVARALNFNPDDAGLNINKALIQILVGITGIGLAMADYLILKPAAWTNSLAWQTTLFPALVLLIFTGVVEELAFRGVMQRAAEVLGSYGWVYMAAVYSVLQINLGSILHCVFAFGVSLFFGWIVKKTGSISGVGVAHGLINIGLYLVLPYILP